MKERISVIPLRKIAWSTGAMLAGALTLMSPAADAGNARGHLYSTAAVNTICETAQQIVATTSLDVNNAIFSDWEGFVQSDATPYSIAPGFPAPTYAPPEAPDLDFTSTQHVIYGYYGTGNRDFPQVVSCKMKNADYLVRTGLDTGAMEQSCGAVNEYYVNEVLASLTNPEEASVIMEADEVITIDDAATVDPDAETTTGSAWTAGFPDNPYPVLYREFEGGAVAREITGALCAGESAHNIRLQCEPVFADPELL